MLICNQVTFADYEIVLYPNHPNGWVAEIPALPSCYALMDTKEEALLELENVFEMVREEYAGRGEMLPRDLTEIAHA